MIQVDIELGSTEVEHTHSNSSLQKIAAEVLVITVVGNSESLQPSPLMIDFNQYLVSREAVNFTSVVW
jgi:hypothetical protein